MEFRPAAPGPVYTQFPTPVHTDHRLSEWRKTTSCSHRRLLLGCHYTLPDAFLSRIFSCRTPAPALPPHGSWAALSKILRSGLDDPFQKGYTVQDIERREACKMMDTKIMFKMDDVAAAVENRGQSGYLHAYGVG